MGRGNTGFLAQFPARSSVQVFLKPYETSRKRPGTLKRPYTTLDQKNTQSVLPCGECGNIYGYRWLGESIGIVFFRIILTDSVGVHQTQCTRKNGDCRCLP